MKVPNTSYLRDLLVRGGLPEYAHRDSFEFDAVEYDRHLVEVRRQYPTHLNEEHAARAAYRTMTHNGKGTIGPHAQNAKEAVPVALTLQALWQRRAIVHGPLILKALAVLAALSLLAKIAWK